MAILFWVAAAGAAEPDAGPFGLLKDPTGSEIQVFIENDSLGGTDRYYTNGIKIGGGIPAGRVSGLFTRPPNALLDAISDGASNHFGLFIGQNLYTPRDVTIAAPQPNDRPWAAWLYVGAVAQSVKDDRLHTVEFDLGFVGPPALGKPVQTFWHDYIVDAPEPQGWGNQLRGEPGLLLTYLHKRRYGEHSGVQLVPHIGATFGTIMTFARIGGIVRVYVVPNISITGELSGIKIPDSVSDKYKAHYADLDVYGTLNINRYVGIRAGYRSFDLGYLVEQDTGSFVLDGVYFGVIARY